MSSRRITSELLPLFEFSRVVNSSHDLQFILATVLRTLMGKMLTGKGAVLSRADDGSFRVQLAKGLTAEADHGFVKFPRPPGKLTELRRLETPAGGLLRSWGLMLLVPIHSRETIVGYLGLGPRLNGTRYSSDDRALIQSLADLSGSAIEKALIIGQVHDANRDLDRKIQELNTLFELSKELNAGLDLQKILRLLTLTLMGQIGVRQYAVCLRDGDAMEVVSSRLDDAAPLRGILNSICDITSASITTDLLRHRTYREAAASLARMGMEAVVPMHLQGTTKGMILLGSRLRGGTYSKADLEFLYALGSLAVVSIENARLFQTAIEKQKLEDELLIAREIQQGLLPESLPDIPGFDVSAVNIPSTQVGGDYYDVLRRSDREMVLAIGDVSGKGTPAALLMANVQAALRALVPSDESIGTVTGRINDLTVASTRGGSKFITFFWGRLDVPDRRFTYSNAGHNPPILLRARGGTERLEEGGIILGIFPTGGRYREGTVQLEAGDLLVLYTDGVTEAMDLEGREYTEERLLALLEGLRGSSSREIIDAVLKDVELHAHGTAQSDDITLLVVRSL